MVTLLIRDVPADVAEILEARAAEAGQSLSVYAAAELARIAARPTNAEIVDRLRNRDRARGVAVDEILAARDTARR